MSSSLPTVTRRSSVPQCPMEPDDYERLRCVVAMQRLADRGVIEQEIRQEQREVQAELEWRKHL
jgi:hypothetical protein